MIMLVCVLPPTRMRRVHALGRRWLTGYWRAPFITALGVSIVLLLIAHSITASAPEGGWLASQIPAVRDVQEKLGVMTEQNREIAENTRSIKNDTAQINAKMDRLKQETSDDPRKELANLGVPWSTQGFVDAMMASDERTAKLFLDGGMSPAVSQGASAVLYIFQPKLADPLPVLKLLIEGGFDLNTNLIDTRILSHYSSSLPPHFESPDLPADYAAWQGSFGGSALLWVVIRSAWAGPTVSDLNVIRFLRDHGADTKVPRQFLVALQPAWGDMEPYQQVRNAVY